jgi:hypothetical protein
MRASCPPEQVSGVPSGGLEARAPTELGLQDAEKTIAAAADSNVRLLRQK